MPQRVRDTIAVRPPAGRPAVRRMGGAKRYPSLPRDGDGFRKELNPSYVLAHWSRMMVSEGLTNWKCFKPGLVPRMLRSAPPLRRGALADPGPMRVVGPGSA